MAFLAHWKMDEESGTVLLDSVGNDPGKFGANTFNEPLRVPTILERGLLFDGVNDYIILGTTSTSLDIDGSDFSYSFWVNMSRSTSLQGDILLIKGVNTNNCIVIYLVNYNKLRISLRNAGISYYPPDSTTTLPVGGWVNIVVTFQYNTKAIKAYINGSKQIDAISTISPVTNGSAIVIGSKTFTIAANNLFGKIDDFRLYSNILSQTDINILVNEPPKAFYRLDEISGAPINEVSGTAATVLNAPARVNGIIDGAFYFDGVDDGLTHTIGGLTGSEYTYSIWFKRPVGGNTPIDMLWYQKSSSLTVQSSLGWSWNAELSKWEATGYFRHGNAGTDSSFLIPALNSDVLDTNWHHLVVTHTALTGNGIAKVYLDNTLVTTKNYTTAFVPVTSPTTLELANNANNHFALTTLDQVRV